MENIANTRKKPGRPRKLTAYGSALNQVTVHLPPELVAALDSELNALGLKSRSELIREVCQSYLAQRQQHTQTLSLTRRMRDLSKEERAKIMAAAAVSLSEYYHTDPEIQEWQALDTEDFYDHDC
jgi:metal-responsive CopG/Arc/MetJ family transcriptional regulator